MDRIRRRWHPRRRRALSTDLNVGWSGDASIPNGVFKLRHHHTALTLLSTRRPFSLSGANWKPSPSYFGCRCRLPAAHSPVFRCPAPAVSSRNPCPRVFRLPALSVDGASQNVQVARRPSVCRGNWLPVALFPGKRTLAAPSTARLGSPFDASAAEESGQLHIRGYLLLKLRRFSRNSRSSPPAFLRNLQIDAWSARKQRVWS